MYPSIFRRYVSALIDTLLAYGFALLLLKQSDFSSYDHPGVFVIVFLSLSYEPILTSAGCTLGQFLMRYRVRNQRDNSKIKLFQAYIRLIVKLVFGIISILVIPLDKKRRGLHDHLSETIVVESKAPFKFKTSALGSDIA